MDRMLTCIIQFFEENGKIPLISRLLSYPWQQQKLCTIVYIKPTHADRLLDQSSYNPTSHKAMTNCDYTLHVHQRHFWNYRMDPTNLQHLCSSQTYHHLTTTTDERKGQIWTEPQTGSILTRSNGATARPLTLVRQADIWIYDWLNTNKQLEMVISTITLLNTIYKQTTLWFEWDSAKCDTYSTNYYQWITLESWFTNLEEMPLNHCLQWPVHYKQLTDILTITIDQQSFGLWKTDRNAPITFFQSSQLITSQLNWQMTNKI